MFEALIEKFRPKKTIVIVSGLPRSGTSMMMKMLEAGGMEILTDEVREADEDNPRGYYEDERVKDLEKAQAKDWLREAEGKALKVVSFLLKDLPTDCRYKVVFMRRDVREILASQKVMLERRGEAQEQADEDEAAAIYERHLRKADYQLRHARHFEFIDVNYREALQNPRREAERVNRFLGGRLDVDRMVKVVDPQLYRQRSGDAAIKS